MRYQFVDAHGFAGGFTLGAVQAGLELVGKRETSAFGVANMEVNRHLLGNRWATQIDSNYDAWEPVDTAVAVLGNPPCSGFSLMTHRDHRGVDAAVNACMKGFALFAAKQPNLQIAVFESVQQAYTQGVELMRWLRNDLEERTQRRFTLYHVLHNGYSLGGSSIRRRYFWVASAIPFGIDPPKPTRVPVLWDAIGDLEGMAPTWEYQPYRKPAGWWVTEQGMRNGRHASTDGHHGVSTVGIQRNFDLITPENPWPIKKVTSDMIKSYYELYGDFPESWQHLKEKMLSKRNPDGTFRMGYIQPCRWNPDAAGRVITGAGMLTGIHPYEDRMFTHREVARIMGFPDDWRILPNRGHNQLAFNWGKGILTQCGKWIGGWIQHALDGEPSDHVGTELGEREYVMNFTNAHKHLSREK